MERLTYEFNNIITGLSGTSRFFNKLSRGKLDAAISKLCEYENAEEQGLLVRLPCKVGDTCYEIIRGEIVEHPLIKSDFPFLDKIYSSREEAEAALAKEET